MFDEKNPLVVHTIYGDAKGVVIYRRGIDDSHLCVKILVEDDGSWFETAGGFSTYWLPDLYRVLVEAQEWLDANAIEGEWGYDLNE